MKNFFRIPFVISVFICLSNCGIGDFLADNDVDQDFLIFGHFYGECHGEGCVETFKLTDEKLFEDISDSYNEEKFVFIELGNDKFELVKDLMDFFPDQLLNESETRFGCPDCTDGGGLFIQHSEDGNTRSWRIDQDKANVPGYLHDFMDKVNEKIELISG